jgi:hypothetical protein
LETYSEIEARALAEAKRAALAERENERLRAELERLRSSKTE